MSERWKFEVTQDGEWCAGGDCPDQETAQREAGHYAMIYGQDGGNVTALVWTGRKPRASAQHRQGGRTMRWIAIVAVMVAAGFVLDWNENHSPWGRDIQAARAEALKAQLCGH